MVSEVLSGDQSGVLLLYFEERTDVEICSVVCRTKISAPLSTIASRYSVPSGDSTLGQNVNLRVLLKETSSFVQGVRPHLHADSVDAGWFTV